MGIFGQGKMGGAGSPAPAAGAARAPAGFNLGNLMGTDGSADNTEMIMALLDGATQSAEESQNPLLALLTPIATSYIGARAQKRQDAARSAEISRMTDTVLGPGASADPRMKGYLDIMGNEDAPDYLQQIASQMLKGAVPYGGTTGGKRSSGGGTSPASPTGGGGSTGRLVGEQWVNGVLHGRDRSGVWHPYRTADGQLVTSKNGEPSGAGVPPPVLPRPEPVMPKEPASPDYDPLGIR